jgi:ZIP family zinc transporter
MVEAAFWGLIGASALVIGAEVAFGFKLSRMVIGLIMAFGVGALISAVSFELVAPAMEAAEAWKVVLGLALGSAAFFFGDRAIATMGGAERRNPDGDSSGDSGLGIVLGTVLDGVPESAVLGMSLVGAVA